MKFASLWHPKAKLWVSGRQHWEEELRKKVGKIDLDGPKKPAEKTEVIKPVEDTKPVPPKVEDTPKTVPTPEVESTPKVEDTPKVVPAPKVKVAPKVEATPKVKTAPKVEPSPLPAADKKETSATKVEPATPTTPVLLPKAAGLIAGSIPTKGMGKFLRN